VSDSDERWELNYFNYFTEVEEHFQKVRGTGLFLLSPLDWALIESWKNAGIPLTAVLRGIEAAFEKWRNRKTKTKTRIINSLAYCTQAVIEEAEAMAGVEAESKPQEAEPPFSLDDLRRHLSEGLDAVRKLADPNFRSIATALEAILKDLDSHYENLEELEQRLTALEEKAASIARIQQSEEDLFQTRRDLERQLKQYRGKMTTEQLAMLEKQYLERHLLEGSEVPRLSLFYLR
jgi:hypothetical protein